MMEERVRPYKSIWWAFPVLGLLLLLFFRYVLKFDGLYGQDAYAYLEYADEWRAWLLGGPKPTPHFWPEGYAFLGALLSVPMGDTAFALQFISVMSWAGTAMLLSRMLLWLPGVKREESLYLVSLGVLLSPFFFRSSLLVMSDGLTVFLIAAVLDRWFIFGYYRRTRDFAFLVLLAGYAVLTRYPAALLMAFPVGQAVWTALQGRYWRTVGAGVLAVGGMWLLHQFFHGATIPEHHFLDNWSLAHFFQRDFNTIDGEFHFSLPNFLFNFSLFYHPGFLGLLVLGLPLMIFRRRITQQFQYFLLLPPLLYVLFLSGVPFQNRRFLLLGLPFLVLATGKYLLPFLRGLLKTKFSPDRTIYRSLLALVAVAQSLICIISLKTPYRAHQLERQISQSISQTAPHHIYTFGLEQALKYRTGLPIISLYDDSIPPPERYDFLIFNDEAFAEQWKDTPVMQHREQLREQINWKVREKFNNGWILYESY